MKMTTFSHTWGPLYETLKEMERNGDEHKDEKLQYAFKLFERLDNTHSLIQIRKLVINGLREISPTEQKRLCSPCFDGIVETIYSNKPTELILNKYPQHIEAFKYYITKLPLNQERKITLMNNIRKNDRFDYIIPLLHMIDIPEKIETFDYSHICNVIYWAHRYRKTKFISLLFESPFSTQIIKQFCYGRVCFEEIIEYLIENNYDLSFLEREKVINEEIRELIFGS